MLGISLDPDCDFLFRIWVQGIRIYHFVSSFSTEDPKIIFAHRALFREAKCYFSYSTLWSKANRLRFQSLDFKFSCSCCVTDYNPDIEL